ncbi:hypothetical protein [Xanthomonas citri]|uniref:hypothetical protein n=1 Tax=Xanthomonas citri TaxID=346 RepID=UPI0015529B23|nr:hypothetical protein [Xanthomonas citri]
MAGFLRDKSRDAWLGRSVRLRNRVFVPARLDGKDRRTIAALHRLEFAHARPAIHCTASSDPLHSILSHAIVRPSKRRPQRNRRKIDRVGHWG